MKRLFISLLALLFILLKDNNLFGQTSDPNTKKSGFLITPAAGFHIPLHDLKQRFGNFYSLGLNLSFKKCNGVLFGLSGSFLFNENVKERGMLRNITTYDGFLIGGDGTLYDLFYYMRGLHLQAHLGYIIPKTGHNSNSGIIASLSPGYLMHRIRFEPEDRNAPLPQLSRERMKAYDRLSGGISMMPAIGYFFIGNRQLINFYFQLEYTIAFTENIRAYQYDQPVSWNEKRKDGYAGLRFGWILPIFKKQADEYFSY